MFVAKEGKEESSSSIEELREAALILSNGASSPPPLPPYPPLSHTNGKSPIRSPIPSTNNSADNPNSLPTYFRLSSIVEPPSFPPPTSMLRLNVEISQSLPSSSSFISHIASFSFRCIVARTSLPSSFIVRHGLRSLEVTTSAISLSSLVGSSDPVTPATSSPPPSLPLTLSILPSHPSHLECLTLRLSPHHPTREVAVMRADGEFECHIQSVLMTSHAIVRVVSIVLMHGEQLDYVEHLHFWTPLPPPLHKSVTPPLPPPSPPPSHSHHHRRKKKHKKGKTRQPTRRPSLSPPPSPSPSLSLSLPASAYSPCCACGYRASCRSQKYCRCRGGGMRCKACASDFCENDAESVPWQRSMRVSRKDIKQMQREVRGEDEREGKGKRKENEEEAKKEEESMEERKDEDGKCGEEEKKEERNQRDEGSASTGKRRKTW